MLVFRSFAYIGALRDLEPFVQFKKREKYSLRNVTLFLLY